MNERLDGPESENATFSGRQLADELKDTMPENQPHADRLDDKLQEFSADEQHLLLRLGDSETGIEFVALGDPETAESFAPKRSSRRRTAPTSF